MLNIVLACQYGASTGILCENIKNAAREAGEDVVVNAYSYTNIGDYIDAADIILLGPQIRFQLKKLESKFADKHVPFMIIDTQAYGMLNGKKVFLDAKQRIEEFSKEGGGHQ